MSDISKPVLVQVFTAASSLGFLENQTEYFRKAGFRVEVVCAPGPEVEAMAGRLRCQPVLIPFTRAISFKNDITCLWKLIRFFRQLRPTVVHVNTPKAGLLGMLAAWLTGVPVRIYELHGLPLETRRGRLRKVLRRTEQLTCSLATTVLAVSASLRARIVDERICPPERVQVLGAGSCNGVDARGRFNPDRITDEQTDVLRRQLGLSGRVLGFVGRLTSDKGILELADSWRTLRARYPDLSLLLIGPDERGKLRQDPRLARLFQDSRVRVLGAVSDVERYYRLLDVLVLPTYREGLGQVLLEAAAMRVPVVASRVTGTVDAVLDYQTGIFCEPYSAESLTAAVRRYLNDPELAERHGTAARQHALNAFDPERIWTAKRRLYEELLQGAGVPVRSLQVATA